MVVTWKVTQKGHYNNASYSGDLNEALEKAKTDLKKYLNDKDITKWVWLKGIAEAKIAANKRAIERAQIFIKLAKEELKKQEAENGQSTL